MKEDDKPKLYVAHTLATRTWVHDEIFPKLEKHFEVIDPFRDRRKQYKGMTEEKVRDMIKDLHTSRWVVDHDLGDIATCDALLLINAEGPSYGSILELAYAVREIEIRLGKGGDVIADLGNVAAVLKKRLGFFWVGFYLIKDNRLVLGPFQGSPACVFLDIGKGVCGTCADRGKTLIVPEVHKFPGHVACDPNSKSEIVIPLFDQDRSIRGVLDVDSDRQNDFDEVDHENLEKIARLTKSIW